MVTDYIVVWRGCQPSHIVKRHSSEAVISRRLRVGMSQNKSFSAALSSLHWLEPVKNFSAGLPSRTWASAWDHHRSSCQLRRFDTSASLSASAEVNLCRPRYRGVMCSRLLAAFVFRWGLASTCWWECSCIYRWSPCSYWLMYASL